MVRSFQLGTYDKQAVLIKLLPLGSFLCSVTHNKLLSLTWWQAHKWRTAFIYSHRSHHLCRWKYSNIYICYLYLIRSQNIFLVVDGFEPISRHDNNNWLHTSIGKVVWLLRILLRAKVVMNKVRIIDNWDDFIVI